METPGDILIDVEIIADSIEPTRITRQLRARLIDLKQLPQCWPIQRSGVMIAFRVDLAEEDRDWSDENGQEIGMLLAIRQGVSFISYCMITTMLILF
jgi:hypothetical protein